MSRAEYCSNEHRFFLASEVQVPDEGKMILLAFCTACGEPLKLEFKITEKGK